jgi:hypothetical protein
MNIVIPTYSDHFRYNELFLESFQKFCIDKQNVIINFVITSDESHLIDYLFLKYENLNLKKLILSDLISQVDGISVKDNLWFFIDKYSLQSVKKLYSSIEIDGDYLVIDSENLCLKDFYMSEIFDLCEKQKILFTNVYYQNIQHKVINSCNELLGCSGDKWFFLRSYWFYKKDLVNKLFDFLRTKNECIVSLLASKTFFEYQLYSSFLYEYNLENFLNTDLILTNEFDILSEKNNYEYIISDINDNNLDNYLKIIDSLEERIIRLHWTTEEIKNKILESSKVCIGTFHWDSP